MRGVGAETAGPHAPFGTPGGLLILALGRPERRVGAALRAPGWTERRRTDDARSCVGSGVRAPSPLTPDA